MWTPPFKLHCEQVIIVISANFFIDWFQVERFTESQIDGKVSIMLLMITLTEY